ncbi:hypothetical protein ACWYBT_004136 [Salmonella enterica subsp. enterica serovar Infantis]
MPTSAVPVTSRHARPRRLASIPTDSWGNRHHPGICAAQEAQPGITHRELRLPDRQ